ncbi:MAG TPA: phytanoyl-CoA dioxygenase family protein, partial [Stellaceae bacterium]|nr:phytanoyl-CoA dioxygenase family protein [Stellaceae bacterium]
MFRPAWLLAPFHVAALATGAKSFRDNPIIGSPALNEGGLHVRRMRLAQAMADARRRRLAHLITARDAADFARDGFLVKPSFLSPGVFEELRREALSRPLPARDMIQGDAVTRRVALDAKTLAHLPATRALVANPEWLGLIRYVGSSYLAPLAYVQTVFSRIRPHAVDPQTRLHSDTFHSSVKAWLFLTDVGEDEGPFVYVLGSHLLTPRRLAWER